MTGNEPTVADSTPEQRDALTRALHAAVCDCDGGSHDGGRWSDWRDQADAVLASAVLADLLAAARAEALRDTADAIDADHEVAFNHILGGPSYTTYWLRNRANKEADRG